MSIQVFSTSRLAITAGLDVAPVLSIGLPLILPADTVVRAVRCYDYNNTIILLWSPNQEEVAYCPGRNLTTNSPRWPQQPPDLAARRVDGSFGRFDYAIYAQSWTTASCWAPAMIVTPEGRDGQYETLTVLPWWSSDVRNSKGGRVSEAALLALKARCQALEEVYAPTRRRLGELSSYPLGNELSVAFPVMPTKETWRRLMLSFRFEEAVDLWATFVRQLRSVEAAVHMASELCAYLIAGSPAATSCPSNALQSNRLGVWANDVPHDWLQFLLRAGYKIYVAHKAEPDALFPIDYCTITSDDWAEGDNAQEMERNQWFAAARDEGWRLQAQTGDQVDFNVTIIIPERDSGWQEPWSDPRNYGYVMGGEEPRARLLPPISNTALTGDASRTAAIPMETTPGGLEPPPAYSTLPDARAATVEGADGVTYRLPARDSRLYRRRLERVVIDPAHHPWLQPPARREMGRGRAMEAFIPVEVTINGQPRTVFRRIGTRSSARNGYTLAQDYENRRNIYLPPSFRPPVGTVDEELWGFPAPVTYYFELPDHQDVSHAVRPSVWLYPVGRAARNLARVGAVPPRPSASQLPRLSDEVRQPLLNENPEDCVLSTAAAGEDDDGMDEDGDDFYSMPVDDGRQERTPSPLPLYSATARGDDRHVEGGAAPTPITSASAGESSETAAPTLPSNGTQREGSRLPSQGVPQAAADITHPVVSGSASPRPSSPPSRPDDSRSYPRRGPREDERALPAAPNPAPAGLRAAPGPRPASRAPEQAGERASSLPTAPASLPSSDGQRGWGLFGDEAVASDWRHDSRPWAGSTAPAPPSTASVGTSVTNGFLVIRHINRWVHAADLETALRRLFDSMPGARPRLLTAYGRNARAPTEQERRERRSPPFNFYLQFATEADALRVQQAMGHPWPIRTTNRQGEERGNRGIFRAYNIDVVSLDEFRAVRSDPNAWVYPWQGLYDTTAAPLVNPAGSIGGPATTAPPPTWLTPAQQAAFGAAHAAWPFPTPAFLPYQGANPFHAGAGMGAPFVMVPSGMLGSMFPPQPQPPTALGPAVVGASVGSTPQPASASSSLSPPSTGRSLASRLSSPSPEQTGLSLLDRISDRDSDASDSRGRRRSRARRRRGYSPPSYNEPGPSRRRSPPPPPPPPSAGACV